MNATTRQRAVLVALNERPGTARHIAHRMGNVAMQNIVRRRLRHLEDLGLARRVNTKPDGSIVWQITAAGEQAAGLEVGNR